LIPDCGKNCPATWFLAGQPRFFDGLADAERLDGDTIFFKRVRASNGTIAARFPHELWGFPRICDESQS
jgi:hypothetical protein